MKSCAVTRAMLSIKANTDHVTQFCIDKPSEKF